MGLVVCCFMLLENLRLGPQWTEVAMQHMCQRINLNDFKLLTDCHRRQVPLEEEVTWDSDGCSYGIP